MRTWNKVSASLCLGLAFGLAGTASAQVFPNQAHAAYNFIPLGNHVCTYHQVYAAAQFGSSPIEIRSLGFASNTGVNGQTVVYTQLRIAMGYTDRSPGGLSSNLPDNPRGTLTEVFNQPGYQHLLNSSGTEDFSMVLRFSTPFCYDPNEGNLLIEIYVENSSVDVSTSRCAGIPDASRAWNSTRFGNNADNVAQRMLFEIGECSGGGPTLRISGDCPGRVTVAWANATPSRPMGIALANSTGSYTLPGGICAGTQLGLSSSGLQLVYSGNTGANGSGQVSSNAGTGACRKYLQMFVVDGSPCAASNVVQIP